MKFDNVKTFCTYDKVFDAIMSEYPELNKKYNWHDIVEYIFQSYLNTKYTSCTEDISLEYMEVSYNGDEIIKKR